MEGCDWRVAAAIPGSGGGNSGGFGGEFGDLGLGIGWRFGGFRVGPNRVGGKLPCPSNFGDSVAVPRSAFVSGEDVFWS